MEEAITGILSALDPHSSYSSAEEMKSITESFDGSFSGIGVEFDVINDTIIVVNTVAGGPAESVGIDKTDDYVFAELTDENPLPMHFQRLKIFIPTLWGLNMSTEKRALK